MRGKIERLKTLIMNSNIYHNVTTFFLKPQKVNLNLGVVGTWNIKCGIAEYTKYLLIELGSTPKIIFSNIQNKSELLSEEAEINVRRCWNLYYDNLENLFNEIISHQINIVHVQFSFGFFNLDSFSSFIGRLKDHNIKTVITFHSTQDQEGFGRILSLASIKEALQQVHRIIVHQEKDRLRLNEMGITKNIAMIAHGCKIFKNMAKVKSRKKNFINKSTVLSSFGFLVPHKGILETIESILILKKKYNDILYYVVCALYPGHTSSTDYYNLCREKVEQLSLEENVKFIIDFLPENKLMDFLQISDVIIMPYLQTKESASGAVRLALASSRPVLTTNIPIFSEFNKEIHKIDSPVPMEIANGIDYLLSNKRANKKIIRHAAHYINQNNWKKVGQKHLYEYFLEDVKNEHNMD